jgi:hypothetical protein
MTPIATYINGYPKATDNIIKKSRIFSTSAVFGKPFILLLASVGKPFRYVQYATYGFQEPH